MRRRTFLVSTAGSLLCRPARGAVVLYRHYPRFPAARELWVVPFAGDVEEGILLETAAGLAGRAALHSSWRTLVYEHLQNEGYQRWFAGYCATHRPKLAPSTIDEVVGRLADAGLAKGFLLYRFEHSDRPLHSSGPLDESANVATSLAAPLAAVAVSERLADRVAKLGLEQILDVRERTEAWCLETYGERFSTKLLGTCDPKTRNARSLMVALGSFVCCARGETYLQALRRCEPDSPVIGWGCAGEDTQTVPSSKLGLFQTATNWCHNLTVFAGEELPATQLRQRHPLRWWELDWGDGRHHACLTLSDGDNIQWLMGNFLGGSEGTSYYNHPRRGRIPFGWGLPVPGLAQLAPRTLAEVLRRASPNDDFVLYSGGGYFYPDLYGADRGSDEAMRLHAERLRGYIELTGLDVTAFNFQDWDSPAALRACRILAEQIPGLPGILAFQYYPYSAGAGAIRWVSAGGREVPLVTCRLCLWAATGRPQDTTPAGVAAQLNALPTASGEATEERFSWVIVHAWSRFRRAPAGAPLDAEERGVDQNKDEAGTERGYGPALWAAERLAKRVKLVRPDELLFRIRLRLRSRQTLGELAAEVPKSKLRAEAEKLLPSCDEPEAARRCFELLCRAKG